MTSKIYIKLMFSDCNLKTLGIMIMSGTIMWGKKHYNGLPNINTHLHYYIY